MEAVVQFTMAVEEVAVVQYTLAGQITLQPAAAAVLLRIVIAAVAVLVAVVSDLMVADKRQQEQVSAVVKRPQALRIAVVMVPGTQEVPTPIPTIHIAVAAAVDGLAEVPVDTVRGPEMTEEVVVAPQAVTAPILLIWPGSKGI